MTMNSGLRTKRKDRADQIVVNQGLAENLLKARALIMAGRVFSDGQRIEKPGQTLGLDQEVCLKERQPYASRGGLKLEEALDEFKISVDGKAAADLGASTGGFTDCLLKRGARKVYAVDVDTRQVDIHLREDSRVILLEKNARYLDRSDFEDELDIVTTDLSFISILKVLPAIKEFLGKGDLLSLLKPQFEVGRDQVGKKGLVSDPVLHEEVLDRIIKGALNFGFNVEGLIKTAVCGQRGNQEFFIFWSLRQKSLRSAQVQTLIKEAVWNEKN